MASAPFAKTILLVDDDAIVALYQATQLEALGCKVITCLSSNEAIELGKHLPEIDLILLDIELGSQLDGAQVAGEILSTREIPIIFLAPNGSSEILEKVRGIPRYGYLIKDTPLVMLQAALETAFVLFASHQAEQLDETRWRLGMEGSRTGTWDWDMVTNELFLSSELKSMLAFSNDPNQHTVQEWMDIVHPDDVQAAKEQMSRYLEGKLPFYDNEHRIMTGDGRYIWVLDRGKIVQSTPDGIPLRIAGIYTDITERKMAEIKQRADRLRWEFAVESSHTGVWETDFRTNTNYFSPLLLEQLGFAPGEFPDDKNPWFKNVHPDDIPSLYIAQNRHLSGESSFFEYECRVVLKDGSCRWMFARGKTIEYTPDGQPFRLIGIAVDISERKRIENALYESEELFHNLFMNHTAVMYQVEPSDGAILDANRAAERFYGYTHEQMCALNIKQINTAPPEQVEWNIRKVFSGEMNTFPAVHRLANGDLRSVDVHSTSIHLRGRTLLFSIVQDITERLKAEQAMKMLLAEKDLLIREVHHRIKNDMTVINSLLELQARRISNSEATAALQEASRRIYNMMLLYDRLYRTGDNLIIHAKPYFETLLTDLAKVMESPDRRITIEYEIAEMILDSRKSFPIGIVINECITNAYKYAFSQQDEGKIRVSLQVQDGVMHLSIDDNGCGLPEGLDIENPSSFGLNLMNIMVSQLNATMLVTRANGTQFNFTIPC